MPESDSPGLTKPNRTIGCLLRFDGSGARCRSWCGRLERSDYRLNSWHTQVARLSCADRWVLASPDKTGELEHKHPFMGFSGRDPRGRRCLTHCFRQFVDGRRRMRGCGAERFPLQRRRTLGLLVLRLQRQSWRQQRIQARLQRRSQQPRIRYLQAPAGLQRRLPRRRAGALEKTDFRPWSDCDYWRLGGSRSCERISKQV